MARRQSDEFDPFDDELFGGDLESVDLDALRLEVDNLNFDEDEDDGADLDADLDEAPRPQRRGLGRRGGSPRSSRPRSASTRPPIRVGALILGFLQVIVYAVVASALFLAIGFGIVYAGQQLGYIPKRAAASTSTTAASVPTAVAAAPTSAPDQPVVVPTSAPPTATPDLGCPSADAWWNSQQVQDNYTYFTQKALTDALGSNRIPALIEQMTIRRDFVDNFRLASGDDPCLAPLRTDLLRAFDATISAARLINSDATSSNEQQANAEKAIADLFDALRALGVTVDAATPAS